MFVTQKMISFALVFGLSPLAFAEMESIADGELSRVTGQSGLTIDYSGQMSLQQFRYEDSGELVAEDIQSGGAGLTDAGAAAGYGSDFDNARLTYDIASDGGLDVLWQSQGSEAIDWGVTVGRVALGDAGSGSQTDVFNNFQAWGLLHTLQRSVLPASVSGMGRSVSYNYVAFTLESLSAAQSLSSIGVDGGYIKSPDFMGNSLDDMSLDDQIPSWASGQRARSTTPMDDLRAGFAAAEFTTYATGNLADGSPNGPITIGVNGFAADIGAQSISVGGTDMGRMALDNLQISDTIITLQP